MFAGLPSGTAATDPVATQCPAEGETSVELPGSGLAIALPPAEDAPDCTPLPPPVVRPRSPDVFGSVALPVAATPLDARWNDIRAQTISPIEGPWADMLQNAVAQDRDAQIRLVNNWVNARIAFADDRTADHWAPTSESIARGRGDCEDYAIAKLQLLENAGVPSDDLYLVIVRDLGRQADHAVLAVRKDDALVVLDSKTDRILRSEEITDYRPIVSYSSQFAWTHGYRSGARALGTIATSAGANRP